MESKTIMPQECEDLNLAIRVMGHRSTYIDSIMVTVTHTGTPRESNLGLGQQKTFSADLGELSFFPTEVIGEILGHLPLPCLDTFKTVNRMCQTLVETLPAYSSLNAYATQALRALKVTGISHHFSAGHLFSELQASRCLTCTSFGAYLYLPTASRVCFSCLSDNELYRLVRISTAVAYFGLTEDEIYNNLTVLNCIPGDYFRESAIFLTQSVARERVNAALANDLGLQKHGNEKQLMEYRRKVLCEQNGGRVMLDVTSLYTSYWGSNLHGWGMPLNFYPIENVVGEGACVFPVLTKGGIDHGISCRGCKMSYKEWSLKKTTPEYDSDWERKRDMTFSRKEFWSHCRGCEGAIKLWGEHLGTSE